jgi:hypothetical protein
MSQVLPQGLWEDIKNSTCMGKATYDGTIDSTIAFLMEEELKEEEHNRMRAKSQEGVKYVNALESSGNDEDVNSFRRRKKTKTSDTSAAEGGDEAVDEKPSASPSSSIATTNNVNIETEKPSKKKNKESAALARLKATHSYLLGGQSNYD